MMKPSFVCMTAVAALMGFAMAHASAAGMDELVAAAKKEGQLTTIALPHDWCGYGAIIDGFKAKYGLTVNELNPDAGSGDEVEAIKANKGNNGPQAPDVIDVGLSFGPTAKADGLIQPYKVSTWATIPDQRQGCRRRLVRRLLRRARLRGEHRHRQEAPPPTGPTCSAPTTRTPSRWPATRAPRTRRSRPSMRPGSRPAAATPTKAPEAGLKFFAELNKNGNFVPVIGKAASVAQGATPVVIRWDYNALADRDTLKGNPHDRRGGAEDAASSPASTCRRSAPMRPHPNAAKLWMEYLYSDEGQIGWLKGYCHPIRFQDLVDTQEDPGRLLAKLPPAEAYAKAVFPTPRPAEHGQGRDHQAVGRGRRRQRQVGARQPARRHEHARPLSAVHFASPVAGGESGPAVTQAGALAGREQAASSCRG